MSNRIHPITELDAKQTLQELARILRHQEWELDEVDEYSLRGTSTGLLRRPRRAHDGRAYFNAHVTLLDREGSVEAQVRYTPRPSFHVVLVIQALLATLSTTQELWLGVAWLGFIVLWCVLAFQYHRAALDSAIDQALQAIAEREGSKASDPPD